MKIDIAFGSLPGSVSPGLIGHFQPPEQVIVFAIRSRELVCIYELEFHAVRARCGGGCDEKLGIRFIALLAMLMTGYR